MPKQNVSLSYRDMDVFRSLMKYHLTGRMIFELSQTFKHPFSSVENTRARLNQLYKAGWLKRDVRFHKERSKNENYYFLTINAASFIEDMEGVSRKKAMFNPVKMGIQNHTFLIADLMVRMNLDIHRFKDICQLVGFIRENNFVVQGNGKRFIKPDGSIFLKVNGQNQLLFLEVDLSTEVVNSPKRETRTFAKKIQIYSEFKNHFQQDELIHSVQGITGYRVLVICKSEQRLQNLLNLAKGMNKASMFWFTTGENFFEKGRNCLFDKIWTLPDGQLYPLF